MKIYLDSNIFIYAALYDSAKSALCVKILRGVIAGKYTAVTSSLSIDEILWKLGKYKGRQIALAEAHRIFGFANLEIVSVTQKDVYDALFLMEKYEKLKPRDAIHAAVSLNSGAYTIYSDDPDFDVIKEIKRIGLKS